MQPLQELLDEHGIRDIDFLSVDVEGGEEAVLRSIDLKRTAIKLIVIETAHWRTRSYLKSYGYRDFGIRTPVGDRFYVGPTFGSRYGVPVDSRPVETSE